jgi:hypothetical protein
MTNDERLFLIQLRSLLLKCVELIERRARLGKYKETRQVTYLGPADKNDNSVTDQPPGNFVG